MTAKESGGHLERVLAAITPEDLKSVSPSVLESLGGMISDALQGRADDEADNKPLEKMSHEEFANFSRRKGYS